MTNSSYRWVIVATGGVLGCVAIGGMFSLPVFLRPMTQDTGWSVTGVSSAMPIGFLAMAFTSMIWGTLSDRLGPLPVVLTGSIVLAASLALAAARLGKQSRKRHPNRRQQNGISFQSGNCCAKPPTS
jgi:predicted MFS family arabinose efflux permease